MATNCIVEKKNNETTVNLLRRFSRKSRAVGFLRTVRSLKSYTRQDSKLRRKQAALMRIAATKKYEKLYKLGKIER